MRKVFTFLIISCLIVGCSLYLIYDKDIIEDISILSIKKTYSRYITPDEELSIILYLSSDESFLTDDSLVSSCYIYDEFERLEVNITEIRSVSYVEKYMETTYYGYAFDIDFSKVTIMDYYLSLENATFEINYFNDDQILLEVGNMNLEFGEINNPTHIEMYRMFGIYSFGDEEYMSGFVLGLDNQTGMDMVINDISIGIKEVDIDIDNFIVLDEAPSFNSDIDLLLGYNYNPLGEVENTKSISINTDTLILLPLKYKNSILNVSRFPVIINFTFNHTEFEYIIDDFQFNDQTLGLEDSGGAIREFIYYY